MLFSRVNFRDFPLIDTHVHLFSGPADKKFPPHPDAPYQPKKRFGPAELTSLMYPTLIKAVVLVHPETYQDDHSWLLHCLDSLPGLSKGICHLFPQKPDTPKRLLELALDKSIVGVRLHAYAPNRLPPLDVLTLGAFWAAAAKAGLLIQLHLEPRYAPAFTPLFESFPEVKVVIDHCGRPLQGTPSEFQHILDWSRFPQVFMKLSMLITKDQYPHRDIKPMVNDLANRFGPDRLLFGATVPCDQPEEVLRQKERLLELLGNPDTLFCQKVFSDNAYKLFGFGNPLDEPI